MKLRNPTLYAGEILVCAVLALAFSVLANDARGQVMVSKCAHFPNIGNGGGDHHNLQANLPPTDIVIRTANDFPRYLGQCAVEVYTQQEVDAQRVKIKDELGVLNKEIDETRQRMDKMLADLRKLLIARIEALPLELARDEKSLGVIKQTLLQELDGRYEKKKAP